MGKNAALLIVCAAVTAAFCVPALRAAQDERAKTGDLIAGAIDTVEKAAQNVSDGNLRLAETAVNILEKDIRLIGKRLPLENIYGALAQADEFIVKKTPARARDILQGALRETERLTSVPASTVDGLQKALGEAVQALGTGSGASAQKAINAANEILDQAGIRSSYRKVQSSLSRAKAEILDGSKEGAAAELSHLKDSLHDLRGKVEAAR